MKNIKDFYEEHKTKIWVAAGIVVVIGATIFAYTQGKGDSILKGKNAIMWKPGEDSMTLDTVKEVLEANKDIASRFAIFREGPNPNEYITITLSEDFIYPESTMKLLEEALKH